MASVRGEMTSSEVLSLDCEENSTIRILIFGTWTGEITPEARIDGGTWASLSAVNTSLGDGQPYGSFTENGSYVADVTGYSEFRITGNVLTGAATVEVGTSSAVTNIQNIAATAYISPTEEAVFNVVGPLTDDELRASPIEVVAELDTTGLALETKQDTGNTSLSSIDTKLSSQATAANQSTGNASLSSIDGKMPALVSGRQPVDGSGVTQPVSGAISVSNLSVAQYDTGTMTGTESLSVNCENMSTARVLVLGTWTGDITPEARISGGTWYAVGAANTDTGSGESVGSFTENGSYVGDITGYAEFRVTGNIATGTATVEIGTSPAVTNLQNISSYVFIKPGGGSIFDVAGPLTDAELRASPVDVLASIDTTGLALETKQDTGNTSLGSIDTKTPALGQALAAASTPVVLTAAQMTTLTPIAGNLEATQLLVKAKTDNIDVALSTVAKSSEMTTLTTAVNTLLKPANTLATVTTVGTVTSVTAIANALPAGTNNIGDVDIASSVLPTGASTLAEQQSQTTALQIMDDWDESDRAKVNLIVGQAGVQGASGTVSDSTQRVVLATDVGLPTGTNFIGYIANSRTVNSVLAYNIVSQVHVAGANTVHWDMFNADATRVIRVLSILQIPNITTAVTGVVFDWKLARTTSAGTGGSAQTAWETDTNDTDLDADVTCRSKPTGGAAEGTILRNYSLSSEETNAATIQIASNGGLELIPDAMGIMNNGRGIVLRQNQGLRCVQITSSNAGNTGWLITFTTE